MSSIKIEMKVFAGESELSRSNTEEIEDGNELILFHQVIHASLWSVWGSITEVGNALSHAQCNGSFYAIRNHFCSNIIVP